MKKISYKGYPEIIHQAIWLYLRFALSFRDVEDLLAERGIILSYETVRRWVDHFGPMIAAELRRRRPKPHTMWHLGGNGKIRTRTLDPCLKASDKPKRRRQWRSLQPPSQNKSVSMSIFLDFHSYILFWPSGACPRGLSSLTYPDGRRHYLRRHGCAVSWEHTGGTPFSECKPTFQCFATVYLLLGS
jgi:hypothetical protein